MTIQQLTYLITIAEVGSLNKASTKLYIAQPSLTASLKELEKSPEFRETKLLNVVDPSLHLDEEVTLSYEEILYYLSKYMTILEPNILEFNS